MVFRLLAALLLTLAPLPVLAQNAGQQPLTVEVLRTSEGSLNANIALIMGREKAVLVDAPFTMADAHRVVGMVLDSGRELETVFITHDHPDHFFAMEVLTEAFPGVRIVAHPTVVADIWRSLPLKVLRWSPMLGPNGPRMPSAPTALDGNTIMLEGHELRILGPMQGDHVHATALYAPDIDALFAGDLLYNGMYMWFGEHGREEIAAWGEAVADLTALDAEIVVAGHSRPDLPNDASSLIFSRDYIAFWLGAMEQAENSTELRAMVEQRFPDAIDALGDFILGNSSRISMGEEPRWEE
ncbi:MBL fold metallo-hydrolase [Parasphingopyxis marina]|uniref:MBL fold metallo-hydrolase n=1 Tax=Parasphingopyxis marina TaxID=2761622 RepID=A0A842I151_9SPHN|nr:MBL fold metallo-hydrolase [Parasphingopyxis marina]MBC2778952.1 MBL fold metallo-hydrolase [Parasphingopyxis marina]